MFTNWIDDYTEEELLEISNKNLNEICNQGIKNSNDPNYKPDCYTKKESNALFEREVING